MIPVQGSESSAIAPGIVMLDGETIYPTGEEWILAFALKGCQWAINIIESGELEDAISKRCCGDGI